MVIDYQKEAMVHQGIYLTLVMLLLVGLFQLITLTLTFSSLITGLGLAAILLFAISDTKHSYGLSIGDIVNSALIFFVSTSLA